MGGAERALGGKAVIQGGWPGATGHSLPPRCFKAPPDARRNFRPTQLFLSHLDVVLAVLGQLGPKVDGPLPPGHPIAKGAQRAQGVQHQRSVPYEQTHQTKKKTHCEFSREVSVVQGGRWRCRHSVLPVLAPPPLSTAEHFWWHYHVAAVPAALVCPLQPHSSSSRHRGGSRQQAAGSRQQAAGSRQQSSSPHLRGCPPSPSRTAAPLAGLSAQHAGSIGLHLGGERGRAQRWMRVRSALLQGRASVKAARHVPRQTLWRRKGVRWRQG